MSFAELSVWTFIMVIASIGASMLIASVLKHFLPFLRKTLVPVSVLGGIILLIVSTVTYYAADTYLFDLPVFGGNGETGLSGMDVLELITYHCLGIGFIATGMRSSNKKFTKRRAGEIFDSGVFTVNGYLIQAFFGLIITLLAVCVFHADGLISAAGLILAFGFGQGTGQALNYGTIYEQSYGFEGGANFGLTVAALGFLVACIGGVIYLVLVLLTVVPEQGILRNPKTGGIVPSPFLDSLVPILLGFFLAVSIPYGVSTRSIRNDKVVVRYMSRSMREFAPFIVLCFAAGQFVSSFAYTNLDMYLSIQGANFLNHTGFSGIPLVVSFLILTACINFFIGSAMAKWALLAPIFVPMLMQMQLSPYFIQAAYRVADSTTNAISPLEPFMAFVIGVAQKYAKNAGLGTIISLMLPYALGILFFWGLFLIIWMQLDLPLGPGAPVYLP